jgi:hypothetical protein
MSDDDTHEVRKDIEDLKEAMVEHRVRLENGVKVFSDFDKRVKMLEPKAIDLLKALGVAASVLGMIFAGIWWVSEKLHDRPTIDQIEKIMRAHEGQGHEKTTEELTNIKESQVEQRAVIKSVEQKLDQLIERRPSR